MSDTPKPPHIQAPACHCCQRSDQQLEGMPERWECSHLHCPLRRPLTAAPGNNPVHLAADGRWRRGARPQE